MQPETRYAKSGEVHIAYQVIGDGPFDLVFPPGWLSHLEHNWEEPSYARFLRRLASFARLILFDRRGSGLSDRVTEPETLEQRMDDVRAVMDAVGSERAALLGWAEGGALCALFAATYPERTSALVLYASYARTTWDHDYPWGWTPEQVEQLATVATPEMWGHPMLVHIFAPSMAGDARFIDWLTRHMRLGMSPGGAVALFRMTAGIDIRQVLPTIRVPTLVLHRAGDVFVRVEHGRYLAANIPGARYVELPGHDYLAYVGDSDAILDEVEEFLTGSRRVTEPDRVLATVLFVDIAGSTERAAALGDRRWHELLDGFYALARKELERFRGREVKTLGDGLLATFDGPARAIRCARAISGGAPSLGIDVRAGLHTGECEVMEQDVGGIAVHIGARVAAMAGPREVLVSSTVKDLVAGSGIEFGDRGSHTLKGVPGEWRLFAVRP